MKQHGDYISWNNSLYFKRSYLHAKSHKHEIVQCILTVRQLPCKLCDYWNKWAKKNETTYNHKTIKRTIGEK